MTAPTLVAMFVVFCTGLGLGWLGHLARAGRAEAQLAALRDNEHLLRHSLGAANEDAAQRNSQALGTLVAPLREAVGALNQQLAEVEHRRIDAYAGLREQVAGMQHLSHQLATQTGQLVSALRAPQIRGRWGEIQLERVVELAGMSRHCDFDTQVTRASRDGTVRPDLVVRLAGDRHIVVDAKAPLTAYLDATAQDDPRVRAEHLTRHARHLRAHIDQLSEKKYWAAFDPAPEFVVLFVPGETFLDAALNADAGLLEYAFARNVILATPTTLVALLRTVAYGWRQDAISKEMATVQQLGRELYARLGVVGGHLDRLGGQLAKAVDAFNQTVGSVESRVLVTARRLHELDIGDREVPAIRYIESRPRVAGFSDINE